MKNLMTRFLPLIVALAVISGCNNTPKALNPEAYGRWINDTDRGLSKHRNIGGIDVSARYLPGAFLAYKEYITSDSASYDSILQSYRCTLSFQLQLSADKNDRSYGNLMYHDIANQEAFAQRSRFLSFQIQEFISLTSGEIEYEPVLSHFEGYDPMGNRMSFQVVFIVPDYNCGNVKPTFDNMTLTFSDPYWKMGTVNFEFEKNNILSLPKLEF